MALTLMKGSEAIAEAAIRAGARFFFGYPITPQTEIPEYMSARMPEIGGCFLQAESEVAAINMVYGAAGTGARVITSSSSPGVSLKQEGISYCAGAMVPAVIINVMRGGPGLGNIQASQGDYFQGVKGGGNGDYHLLTFAPASVQEAIDLMMIAYDKAEKYRIPVLFLADGIIAQMMEPGELRSDPVKAQQYETLVWEAASVGRAKGVALTDEHINEVIHKFRHVHADNATSSLQRDFRIRRKQTELETFSGYIVKEAKRLGVSIPLSEKMYQGLKEMAAKF